MSADGLRLASSRGRAPVAAVDLAWMLPTLWLAATLLGADGTRAAFAFGCLHPCGLLQGQVARRIRLRHAAVLAAQFTAGTAALALAAWAGLHPDHSFLDPAWLITAASAVAGAPYHLGPEVVLLPAGALLFWRGSWLAARGPGHREAGVSFQTGMVVLAAGAVLGGERHAAAVLALTVAFLSAGLLGLAILRGEETGARRDLSGRLWAVGFTGVLLLAAFALATSGGAVAQALADLAARAFDAFLGGLNAFISWMASLFSPEDTAALPPDLAPPPQRRQTNPMLELLTVPEPVRRVGTMGVMLAFVVPLVVAVVRYLGELWRKLTDPLFMAGVRLETIEGEGLDIARALRGLLFRFARLLWRSAGGRSLDGDPRGWPVRLAYRDLLRRAAARGVSLPASATATERMPALLLAYPGHEEDLAAVTRAYEEARYGPSPERAAAAEVRLRVRRVTRRRWFGH